MTQLDSKRPKDEFTFQWHITNQCTRRCKHCYHDNYEAEVDRSRDELLDIAGHIIAALKKWGHKGRVSLTGGEPFTRKKDLLFLLKYLDDAEAISYLSVMTNGDLIDDETSEALSRISKIGNVQVSLEAPTRDENDRIRGEGSFDNFVEAISHLKTYGIPTSTMMTLSKLNVSSVARMVEFLDRIGVDRFSVDRFIPEGQSASTRAIVLSEDELCEAYEQILQLRGDTERLEVGVGRVLFAIFGGADGELGARCTAGYNQIAIMPNGDLLPCRRLPIRVGNVLEDNGFFKAWYKSDVLWNLRDESEMKGKCGRCELRARCAGCRAAAYVRSGDYMSEDPQCWK